MISLMDNYGVSLLEAGHADSTKLYTLQALSSAKKTSKLETKLGTCFSHKHFSRSHNQKFRREGEGECVCE